MLKTTKFEYSIGNRSIKAENITLNEFKSLVVYLTPKKSVMPLKTSKTDKLGELMPRKLPRTKSGKVDRRIYNTGRPITVNKK
jgi:hypothetical protein